MLMDLKEGQCACGPENGRVWEVGPRPDKASWLVVMLGLSPRNAELTEEF